MLRCDNQLRLHKEDYERLYKMTGVEPSGITSVNNLNQFIDHELAKLKNGTLESILLKMILEDEKVPVF